MKVHVGTSGFQYPEWKGTFYPEDLARTKMLPFYAAAFCTTEINYSFRRVPSRKTLDNWDTLTPARFVFSLKAPQKITHFSKLKDCGESVEFFFQEISHLGAKMGPVLFQLPPYFHKDAKVLRSFLEGWPKGRRAAFEFRHESWFDEEVFALMKEHNVALCVAESAELSTPVEATADFGYLRLRREDYAKKDIARWAEVIKNLEKTWGDAFVYFKHEASGVGPEFASTLKSLLPTELVC